jgi:hypothetical protein
LPYYFGSQGNAYAFDLFKMPVEKAHNACI